METTFLIKETELNADFIVVLKKLFKKKGTLQITISDSEDFDLYKTETADEFMSRINASLQNLNNGENTVSFDAKSFDDFVKERI